MKFIYAFLFFFLFSFLVKAQCTNNWINVLADHSGIRIGQINITGNQVTIEAKFDRSQVFDPNFYGGDLVSKHRDPNDVNYLLRPNVAEITTTNGFYITPTICSIDTGKTYYAALVYDGDSLKFYRNGFLMSAVPASGDLIQNNWPTTIGATADTTTIYPSNFAGYINEVRIWNVARSQDQLKQYMNTSLPNPTTQTGLLAYYQLNSLTNLQGNAAWNGRIIGSVDTSQTNPTCPGFIADSCGIIPGTICGSSWLNIIGQKSGVQIGDLDITGNKITVEASFNRDQPYSGDRSLAGDVVSKHTSTFDVNYLLRADEAEITTDHGWVRTPEICDIDLNKTYYVALVYDGDSLKFYRNGFLMSAIPQTGNIVNNNWLTTIGTTADLSNPYIDGLLGYINEVRIWNVARTQTQLKKFMNIPLPNPTTQKGLLAYYEFNSLTNLQGNAAWNGTLIGTASINQTNSTCADFVADSCDAIMPVSLRNFQGSLNGQSVNLYWTTFNEINTASDIVERSYDGKNFTDINSLPAKGSLQQNNYQFADAPSFTNKNVFYRIKFVDKNKVFTYSNVLVFTLGKISSGSLQLFPNPAKNYVQVNYNSDQVENSTIRITDIAGRIVLIQNNNTLRGNNSVLLNFQNKLPSGNYFVQIILNGRSITDKLIVE